MDGSSIETPCTDHRVAVTYLHPLEVPSVSTQGFDLELVLALADLCRNQNCENLSPPPIRSTDILYRTLRPPPNVEYVQGAVNETRYLQTLISTDSVFSKGIPGFLPLLHQSVFKQP